MESVFQKWVFRVTIIVALIISVADQLSLLPAGSTLVPRLTLVLLALVTIGMRLEIGKLNLLDKMRDDLDKIAKYTVDYHGGISKVASEFSVDDFAKQLKKIKRGENVRILQTYVPYLAGFRDDLVVALKLGATIQVLLVRPDSPAAELRTSSLASLGENVAEQVKANLGILSAIYRTPDLTEDQRNCLQVRGYNALISVSMYQIGQRITVGMFFQELLAIRSPQLVFDNDDSTFESLLDKEFNKLWLLSKSTYEYDLMKGRFIPTV